MQPGEQDPGVLANDVIRRNIEELRALEAGWDGLNSLPINRGSLAKLLGILGVALQAAPDLIPALVPLHSGGVQAEWHGAGRDVEVCVEPDGQIIALAAEGENYHADIESADILPNEALQALCNFLPYLRPS
ncbi:MAG TPA: hypothetical protein VLE73_06960 [Candidatus Saccharimonadales bacterium]|nr:hypothetical protein [Candidatus Saccharimonadales bacterium]